jgi:hypothetical protein
LESSEINHGVPSDVPRLADREQERARADESDPHDDGEEDRKNKRLVRRAPEPVVALACANFGGGDWRQRSDDAEAEEEQRLIEKETK